MKEFKGTKGEWADALTPMRKSKVVDVNGFSICTLSAGTPTDRANAKLISASPDLLEALKDTIEALRTRDKDDAYHAIVKGEEAILKALNL